MLAHPIPICLPSFTASCVYQPPSIIVTWYCSASPKKFFYNRDLMLTVGKNKKSFWLRMLGGSHVGYVRATRKWWAPVENLLDTLGLQERPVYFVSSNTHSFVNLMSGSILNREAELTEFALSGKDPYLADECRKIQQGEVPGNWQNFLYFAAREWVKTPAGQEFVRNRAREEQERGIWYVGARHGLEIDAQIFELAKLRPAEIDPRCRMSGMDLLARI